MRVLILFVFTLTCFLAPVAAQPKKLDPAALEALKQKMGGAPAPGALKKYDDVITKDAKTLPGVFAVHRIDEKIYFEIPQDAFNKLMLWQLEVAKGPAGISWGGKSLGYRAVRLERRGNKVFLWQASFDKRADGKAIQRAVDSANMDSIIYNFNVEAEGKDRTTVINATSLFMSDVADFSVKGAVGGGASIDDSRSYLDDVKAFPTNIEVRALLTFRGGGAPFALGKKGPPAEALGGGGGRSHTAVVHHSLVMLPDRPMMGRNFDPRVGYFARGFEDYAADKTWMVKRQYINRFRLEKKDPTAEVSEVVKPITFYLAAEVPEKWRPHMIKGVEDWQPAFEKVGYKKAIVCREAPTRTENPNWDPEDARHSVIRWVADPTKNAMGPHIHDPRTGEIISAHIIFWHDILKLEQEWYFVQCGAVDPRCKKLPLPDDLIGDLMRNVTTHEVGHTLGLRHNHRASSAYTTEQLRDPKFTAKYGTNASIMSYGRHNYLAQPEDKITQLINIVGPYDFFAIDWGYRSIAGAKSPEDERTTLDKWASRQMTEPWLRFGGEDGPAQVDPTVKTENVGSDSVQATALALKNIDRVLDKIVDATTTLGEDYELLKDIYKSILSHRRNWFGAVALNIGGVVESRTLGGRGTESFTRVSKEKQQEAVKFLLDNALTTPTKLLSPAIVNRFQYSGVASEVMSQQRTLLTSLLGNTRIRRLMDAEILDADKAYSALNLVNDVQDGVWSELKAGQPKVDTCRRALQRVYVEHLKNEVAPKDEAAAATPRFTFGDDEGSSKNTDLRAVARSALTDLLGRIDAAFSRTQDSITRVHLLDCRREIEAALNPKKGS